MADQKRRLAAILSADVVGYSRLMGDDEEATIEILVDFRDVFSKRVENHDGRVVDTAGDSVLSVFDSVVEAVRCAMEIQIALSERNEELSEDRKMRFRIGINLGDIVEKDDGTVRYADAERFRDELLEKAPDFPAAHIYDAMLRNASGDEAGLRKSGEEIMRLMPKATVAGLSRQFPYAKPEHQDRLLEGLRAAGLPES